MASDVESWRLGGLSEPQRMLPDLGNSWRTQSNPRESKRIIANPSESWRMLPNIIELLKLVGRLVNYALRGILKGYSIMFW